MTYLYAEKALTAAGWHSGVRLSIESGRIATLEVGQTAHPGDERHAILLPGMPNLHSHAFQRGMAGLAEWRGGEADSFWTWRDEMYRFALSMTPDQVEAVAAQLYVEMLEAGFTRVGEFHYLHHDRDGRPYASIAEMANRIAAAAAETSIGLTLLPVFYAHAGFGAAQSEPAQRRFVSTLDGFAQLFEGCREAIRSLDQAVIGVAPHSLRAAAPAEISTVVALAGPGPVHIHVAEQKKEVEECQAWCGARPVEFLLGEFPVNALWCLVHATHMTEIETGRLARSGATAGLCPITEANLGDGTFNAASYRDRGGRFGIGSDSNILIGVAAELRQLEYSQRLETRTRNVLAKSGGSTGRTLFEAAIEGGALALGRPVGRIAAGAQADLISLDANHPVLIGRSDDKILDSWIFAGDRGPVDCVFVAGRKLVSGGRHMARDRIFSRFNAVMRDLLQS